MKDNTFFPSPGSEISAGLCPNLFAEGELAELLLPSKEGNYAKNCGNQYTR